MKIETHIKRHGLHGQAVTKAKRLDATDHAAAVAYCRSYSKGRKTLPATIASAAKTNTFVDQIVVHKEFPSEALSAKDIYFLAYPTRAVEYLHCTKKRRIAIGEAAQFWTNARVDPSSGTCKSHFILVNSKKQTTGRRPRLLKFVGFGGAFTKTGHTKVFSWASVREQFVAEGIPLR